MKPPSLHDAWRRGSFLIALAALIFGASAQAKPVVLANHCFRSGTERYYVKPTGLGTSMLLAADGRLVRVDGGRTATPGPDAEFTTGELARFRLKPAGGCRSYPEASLGASGTPFRGRVYGFADAHLHLTADMRAGGRVIYGESFDRFGITEALGHDADEHGSDGSQDVTGNLLRDGKPTGTHDTHGWPTFAGWPVHDTYTHQQTYYRWLERAWLAGERLVVAQTVEDEPLCNIEPQKSHSCDETATVELQAARLRALQDYVDAQGGGRGRGWFRLVYTPAEAERVIRAGKLAVITGVESSNPFGCGQFEGQPKCDQAAIDAGIARLRAAGVRALFLTHWVDNALAGAALESGDKGTFIGAMQLSSTGQPFSTGDCPEPGQGDSCNTKGLTDLGAYAVNRLMDNHMLIEADHLSERARQQVLTIAEQRRYPLVSSHTGTGGVWTPDDLRRLFAIGGFATATLDDVTKLGPKILAFGRPVGLGTDTGGFNALPGAGQPQLKYPFRSFDGRVTFTREKTGERVFDLNRDGVAHYGLLPDLLADVQQQPGGRRALAALFGSAAAYLRTWRLTGA